MASSIKRVKQNDGRSDNEMYGDSPIIDERRRAAMDSHCEIERRRRNKMVTLVNELSDIVPACNSFDKRKPDKLTILKLAVEHLRSLKSENSVSSVVLDEADENKSSFLTDSELKKLVLEATSGFLFVVVCTTGKVIYVSDTVADVLGVSKNDWEDVNLDNMVHPEDRPLLKKQLKVEEHELQPAENISQGVTGSDTSPPGELCRRSFIVKMKTQETGRESKEIVVTGDDGAKYVVVHVTGYIRHWPNAMESYHHHLLSSQSCLIAIGQCKQRLLCEDGEGTQANSTSFLARHKTSGVFTFVDNRVTKVLGYKPADLLQRSIFEFCEASDRFLVEEAFQQVVDKKDQVVNITFKFFNSSGIFIPLRLSCSAFLNPFSEAVEYISSTYTLFVHVSPIFNDFELAQNNKQNNAICTKTPIVLPKQMPSEHPAFLNPFSSTVQHTADACSQPKQTSQQHLVVPARSFASAQNTLPVYDNQMNWLDQQQAGTKRLDRTAHVAPPDYHQHLNMFPHVPDSENYHPLNSNVGNHIQYHWTPDNHTSSDQMASRMIEPERFMDTGGFVNGSAGSACSWSSFETPGSSDFPYACMWQAGDAVLGNNDNNHNDDMCEMINILAGSSPSSSAMFGALDESLVKKFCS